MIIRSIVGFEADRFLDCENGQHEYNVVEEYTGGTRYICSRCGKTEHKSTLSPIERQKDRLEYVMLDPNITTALYSDILRLTVESTGKMIQFQKDVVEVGHEKNCDFLLDGKPTVARR